MNLFLIKNFILLLHFLFIYSLNTTDPKNNKKLESKKKNEADFKIIHLENTSKREIQSSLNSNSSLVNNNSLQISAKINNNKNESKKQQKSNTTSTFKKQSTPSTKQYLITSSTKLPQIKVTADNKTTKLIVVSSNNESDDYNCPKQFEFQLFPHICKSHSDCKHFGREFRCCTQIYNKRCIKGDPKPLQEQKHEPILGIIPRTCPKEPLAELFWDVQICNTDQDCWPRICCPDGRKKYCRTSSPQFDSVPFSPARQLAYPIESFTGYIQCTPPPPAIYDAFPKPCNNTLDCFPNVCCQESGKKHCRPPKRSLLALVTGFAQRFNTGLVKQWTDNLVIK